MEISTAQHPPSAETVDGVLNGPKGIFVMFDYVVSILAIIINCLVLRASKSARFDLRGYKTFFTSLLASNLYLSAVNIVNFIYQGVLPMIPSESIPSKCAANIFRSLQLAGYFANMFNLGGMSIDHYIGVLYPLQYSKLAKASRSAVLALWAFAVIMGFADYPVTGVLYMSNHVKMVPAPQHISSEFHKSFTILNSANCSGCAMTINFTMTDFPKTNLNDGKFSQEDLGSLEQDDENMSFDEMDKNNYEGAKNVFLITNNNTHRGIKRLVDVDHSGSSALQPQKHNKITTFSPNSRDSSGSREEAEYNFQNLPQDDIEDILRYVKNYSNTTSEIIAMLNNGEVDFCRYHTMNKTYLECIVMALTLVCFILLTICYGKVFKEVRNVANISGRMLRKLVATTFLLLTTFTICWIPFMAIEFNGLLWVTLLPKPNLSSKSSSWFYNINNISNSMIIFYPLFQGIIYTTRMRVIRRQMLQQYGRYFPCLSRLIAKLTTNATAMTAYYRAAHRSSVDYRGGSSGEQRSALRQEMLPFVYRGASQQHQPSNNSKTGTPKLLSRRQSSNPNNGHAVSLQISVGGDGGGDMTAGMMHKKLYPLAVMPEDENQPPQPHRDTSP